MIRKNLTTFALTALLAATSATAFAATAADPTTSGKPAPTTPHKHASKKAVNTSHVPGTKGPNDQSNKDQSSSGKGPGSGADGDTTNEIK